MKALRKLVPAIAMLLIATVLMSTASYAWFSMNTTVTAKGMQVTAKTDNAFLIISAGDTLSGNATSATATLNEELYPTKPVVELTSVNIGTATSWGTATSSDPDDASVGAVVTPLAGDTDIATYVAKQSFTVGIVANSGTVANDLKLASLTISDVDDGITVVVVCGGNVLSHNANVTSGIEVLADKEAVTTTGVQIDVYIYFDGSNPNVKTSNAMNLAGNVEMTFSIDA